MFVQRTALVDRPATRLFDLIEAAEDYPRFLPWCTAARIVQRDDTLVSADLTVSVAGLRFAMRTRNPKRRPEFMAIHLEHGPFRRFEGSWQLTPLGEQGCKVQFTMDCEFSAGWAGPMAQPWLAKAADRLVDAFVQRALSVPLSSQNGTAGSPAALSDPI